MKKSTIATVLFCTSLIYGIPDKNNWQTPPKEFQTFPCFKANQEGTKNLAEAAKLASNMLWNHYNSFEKCDSNEHDRELRSWTNNILAECRARKSNWWRDNKEVLNCSYTVNN